MADKSIDQLIAAEDILATDLFVLQQSGMAKKLTGQVLLNWLTAAADGHGGIQSITKLKTDVLADTYRITLADTTIFDFVVTNGRGVVSISKTGTSGLVDTYRISYNDGSSGTFTVTNGEKGDKGDNAYIWIKFASQEPTASSSSFGDIPDNWIGVYFGTASTAPTDWQQYKWFKIKGEKGDTGEPATLVTSQVTYQVGDSGTIIPSGSWSESIPPVPQGKYLWTKEVTQFNSGNPITKYSVSRFGIDGTGAVSTVAGVSPDAIGNVPLTAADVEALPTIGGTMKGSINMNGQKLSGLNAPTADDEAATKGFVSYEIKKIDVSSQIAGKVDKANVVNNFSTTEEGFVADARALKALNDGKLSMELLWENASPTSAFESKTIPVDSSKYPAALVEFAYLGSDKMISVFVKKESGAVCIASSAVNTTRSFTFDSAGMNFNDAVQYTSYSNWSSTKSNSDCIPVRIYGIEGVT